MSEADVLNSQETQVNIDAVSYTHLDVYKRQVVNTMAHAGIKG